MPVAVRLSRNFYERFGDDATNELIALLNDVDFTYRAELKDAFAGSLAVFDAKLERRLAEQMAGIDRRFADMDAKFERRFVEMDAKFESRFVEMDAKFESRFVEMDAKFESRFAEMDAKFESRFVELDTKVERRFMDLELNGERRYAAVNVEFANVRGEIKNSQAVMIRWMFAFWVASTATTISAFAAFAR
ncbi:MAG: hypothetical protein U9Q74_11705 [Gemmatimonadota bacterium]|nr:hypothetical protein [Gemmatimonadota bacterium]